MSVRGGLGRSDHCMSNQIWDSEHLNLPGFAIATALASDATVRPVFGLGRNTSMPYDFPRPTGLTGGLNQAGGLITGRGLVHVVDPDFKNMYLDNWFLGVQRAVGREITVEADYLGSRGQNAYRKFDINRFNGDMLDGRFDPILPGFSNINYTESTDQSTFHGGTVAIKVNRTGLEVGASYTFGKATDYSSSFSAAGRPDAYGLPDQDKGPADFDVRQKFVMSANWILPSPASGLARALGGGWQSRGPCSGKPARRSRSSASIAGSSPSETPRATSSATAAAISTRTISRATTARTCRRSGARRAASRMTTS